MLHHHVQAAATAAHRAFRAHRHARPTTHMPLPAAPGTPTRDVAIPGRSRQSTTALCASYMRCMTARQARKQMYLIAGGTPKYLASITKNQKLENTVQRFSAAARGCRLGSEALGASERASERRAWAGGVAESHCPHGRVVLPPHRAAAPPPPSWRGAFCCSHLHRHPAARTHRGSPASSAGTCPARRRSCPPAAGTSSMPGTTRAPAAACRCRVCWAQCTTAPAAAPTALPAAARPG